MPDPGPDALPAGARALCPAAELVDGGPACLFELRLWGQPAHAFALRHRGRVVAFVNRCAHVPTEMDVEPGRFLDAEGRYIVCQYHGARYDPASGRCVAGPCRGQRLIGVDVREQGAHVYWYPSADLQPPAAT